MAEGGKESDSDLNVLNDEKMDSSDGQDREMNSQNRYGSDNGQDSGRGGWQQVRRRTRKRKKVSSGSTCNIENLDTSSFTTLSNDDKLSCLFELAFKNFHILNEVKREQTTFYQSTKELKHSVELLHKQAQLTERVADQQNKCLKMLAYRSLDTEARSRRNNIIVWGVSEKCTLRLDTLILNFLEDEMSLDTSDMVIDRAHRIGSTLSMRNRNKTDPKRAIIVRFRDYTDTEKVMKNAYKLKGSPFGVDRDYPREIALARKDLYNLEEAKRARENRDKVQIRYPAKLYINGRLVKDSLPEWNQYLNEDRLTCLDAAEQLIHDRQDGGLHGQQITIDVTDSASDSEESDSENNPDNSVFHMTTESDSSETDEDQHNRSDARRARARDRENDRKSERRLKKCTRRKARKTVNKNLPVQKAATNVRSGKQLDPNVQHKNNRKSKNDKNTASNREHDSVNTQHVPCENESKKQPISDQQDINRQRKTRNVQQSECVSNNNTRL